MAKLPKKPKAPKASAGLQTWERFNQRLTEWEKKVAKIKSDATKKANLIKKTRAKVAGLGRKY